MKNFLIFFFLFICFFSNACECPSLQPVSKELSKQYDVIFHGTVDSIVPCGKEGIGTAYFTVIDLYKGSAPQHVSIDYDCTSACLMSFEKNEEWIVYAVYQHFDLLTVNLCSHTRKKITDGTADFYQGAAGRTFEEENNYLKTTLGIQPYASHNKLNDQQKEMGPRNEQPGAWDKLWLLLTSLAVMAIIYFVSKKQFRNDK